MKTLRLAARAFGVVLTLLVVAFLGAARFLFAPLLSTARVVAGTTVRLVHGGHVALLFVVLLVGHAAFSAGPTITVSPPSANGGGVGQGGVGQACTSTGALGLIKSWLLQCDNAKVYVRRTCATSSASCNIDAGYGDPTYDFTYKRSVIQQDGGFGTYNATVPPPAKLLLRSTESRICIRNTAQPPDASTADAGDAFTCWLNEDNPF